VIVVYDFAVAPSEVQLGHGLIADVDQAMQGTPPTEQEHLVAEIQDLGLPAEHAADGAPVAQGSVAIDGQFVSTASSAW
jgi:hypothetical protein